MRLAVQEFLKWGFVFFAVAIVVHACAELDEGSERFKINLRWVRAYEGESKDNVMTGLRWGLSFLGAGLPKGAIKQAVVWNDEDTFTVDISRLGIADEQMPAWLELLKAARQSDEYQKMKAIDLGRFIALTINSSNHYYVLTGAQRSYQAFRSQFSFDSQTAAIIESGVSLSDRLIEISTGSELNTIAFVASEGEGSLQQGNFRAFEYEVFDFMPNGQIRFAIYDSLGQLKTSADPVASLAGKPAKCLWCHEINIQRPFYATTMVTGYYSPREFEEIVSAKMMNVNSARARLRSDVDFAQTQEHTQLELLYISFMEPSAQRLAAEWRMTEENIQVLLAGIPVHKHAEFPFLGDLYHRNDVDHLAPYEIVPVPDDARELSDFEPDFLNHP